MDPRFGMLTRRNLTIWIAAARGDAGAIAELNSHWFSGVQ